MITVPMLFVIHQVFEALEVCTQCEVEGEVEFEFPCLNFIETLSGLWQKDDERYSDAVYGGVRLHTSFQSGAQLKYLFPRIQVRGGECGQFRGTQGHNSSTPFLGYR